MGADQFVSLLAARIPSAANASIAVVAASETVAHLTFTMYEAGAYTLQATAGGTPLQGNRSSASLHMYFRPDDFGLMPARAPRLP